MNFAQFLEESNLKPSLDDSSIIDYFDQNNIYYSRKKLENQNLLYKFDNRYSIIYDGLMMTLYKHDNKLKYASARNKTEINNILDTWSTSYEITQSDSENNNSEDIDDIINQLTQKDTEQENEI